MLVLKIPAAGRNWREYATSKDKRILQTIYTMKDKLLQPRLARQTYKLEVEWSAYTRLKQRRLMRCSFCFLRKRENYNHETTFHILLSSPPDDTSNICPLKVELDFKSRLNDRVFVCLGALMNGFSW